jgi:hypothetical protein
MAPRSNPTVTERRLDRLERENEQLKQDLAMVARRALPNAVPRKELEEIIERYSADGRETRPHIAPESRQKVVA